MRLDQFYRIGQVVRRGKFRTDVFDIGTEAGSRFAQSFDIRVVELRGKLRPDTKRIRNPLVAADVVQDFACRILRVDALALQVNARQVQLGPPCQIAVKPRQLPLHCVNRGFETLDLVREHVPIEVLHFGRDFFDGTLEFLHAFLFRRKQGYHQRPYLLGQLFA